MGFVELWLRIGALFLVLTVAEVAYGTRVQKSFLVERSFAAAMSAGDGCVATAGDSRMVAGLVSSVLVTGLRERDPKACHAQLAIGGADIAAHYLALRRYLEEAHVHPKLVVLGVTLEGTIEKEASPDAFIGNEAVVLGWSRASDVSWLYPGFPLSHFDDGFRFLALRTLATSSFASLTWARTQALQDRLVGLARGGTANRFGMVADMQALARSMQKDLEDRVQRFPEHVSIHPAFVRFLDLAAEHRVPTLVVEMPMPSVYRAALGAADRAPRVRAAILALLHARGGSLSNLGAPTWGDDGVFDDGLHLGARGAELFSRDLARTVSALDGRRPRPE